MSMLSRVCNAGLPLLAAGLLSGCVNFNFPLNFPTSDYQEVLVEQGRTPKILMLDVDGVITSGPDRADSFFSSSQSTVNSVAERLEKARQDPSIRAVVLRIDSPGGGVTASDVVYRMLVDYKKDTGVPIYAAMLDMSTSGGYYIAMSADKIYAHPTTITGSIGVIAVFFQLEELGKKIGVRAEVIKSGDNKDIGSPFRSMEPAQREILQDMIDNMYARFITVVKEGRPNVPEDKIKSTLTDGRILTAQHALDEGMIDGIMYLDEVIDHVRNTDPTLANARVVMYRKTSQEKVDSIYAKAPVSVEPQASQVGLVNINGLPGAGVGEPVFYYLWMP